MTSNRDDVAAEHHAFLENQRDSHLLDVAEIDFLYQEYTDGMLDSYLDELDVGE